MEKYKVTIVTVCYNVANTIKETMESVFSQTYENKEYIIIDGRSTDKTMDVVKRFTDKIDVIVSEPDSSIYDAMNKGIRLAKGDYIIFMNSGDKFNDNNSISNTFDNIANNPDIVYGDAKYRYDNGSRVVKASPHQRLKYNLPFSHQSVFVKTEIMKENPFNLQYKLAADYDFFLTAYQRGLKFMYVPTVVGDVRIDDGNSYQQFYKSKKEVKQIQSLHGFPNRFIAYNYYKATLWYSIKIVIKKIISRKYYNKIVTR